MHVSEFYVSIEVENCQKCLAWQSPHEELDSIILILPGASITQDCMVPKLHVPLTLFLSPFADTCPPGGALQGLSCGHSVSGECVMGQTHPGQTLPSLMSSPAPSLGPDLSTQSI